MESEDQMTDSGEQAGFERAGAIVKDVVERARDTVGSYREGGVGQVSDDILEYVRRQPVTALLIAAGVGLLVGMILGPGRR
ncbi:MAG TPA: hypothetical protein VJX71_22925 [Methylomirabilota bacterium]|nr:hypothetical protein [Methylomirabilota bacterium]